MIQKRCRLNLIKPGICALLLLMLCVVLPRNAHAAGKTLQQLQKAYPAGQYWNGGDPSKTTNKACSDHVNLKGPDGHTWGYRCNWFHDSYVGWDLTQCWGFAFKLGYDAYGTMPGSWTKKGNLSSLKAGDIVRYGNGSHVVFITAVSGDNIQYADCNKDTCCQIRWNVKAKKSDIPIKNYQSAKMSGDGVYSAPSSLRKQTFTVKYNANGGSGSMANSTIEYGIGANLRKNTFTRKDYQFSGWNLYKHSDKTWYYTNGSKTGWYAKGKQPSGYNLSVYKDQAKVTWTADKDKDTIEMFAVWKPVYKQTFTVRYNPNGGTGEMADTVVEYGVGTNLRANIFTRQNFAFGGWNLYKHSARTWYYSNGSNAGWYAWGEQPDGYELAVYKDQAKVAWTSEVDKDIVEFYAVWNFLGPFDLSDATVTLDRDVYTYNGKAKKPSVTVEHEGIVLISGVDYNLTYKANKNAGSATVKVVGTGNYTGSKEMPFLIKKAANPMTVKGKTATVKYSAVRKKAKKLAVSKVLTVQKNQGTVSYVKSKGNGKIKISKTSGKVTVKKGLKKGTYKVTVKVKAAGTKNYKAVVKTIVFTVKVK